MEFWRVIQTATELHADQVDKTGQPYILHPLRVMLSMPLDDRDAQIVALLHDVMEDCGVSWSDLSSWVSPTCAEAVMALSKVEGESYSGYLARVKANPLARRVKLADVTDNECRLASLPLGAERTYLTKKYARAREILGAA